MITVWFLKVSLFALLPSPLDTFVICFTPQTVKETPLDLFFCHVQRLRWPAASDGAPELVAKVQVSQVYDADQELVGERRELPVLSLPHKCLWPSCEDRSSRRRRSNSIGLSTLPFNVFNTFPGLKSAFHPVAPQDVDLAVQVTSPRQKDSYQSCRPLLTRHPLLAFARWLETPVKPNISDIIKVLLCPLSRLREEVRKNTIGHLADVKCLEGVFAVQYHLAVSNIRLKERLADRLNHREG